jgi:hypothetical protein
VLDLEVQPQYQEPTDDGDLLTVWALRGAEDNRVRKTDTSTNQAFRLFDFRWDEKEIRFEYHARYEPPQVQGVAFEAIAAAFATWEKVLNRDDDDRLFTLTLVPLGEAGPQRDGRNTISWRRFARSMRDHVSETFIWNDGHRILEVDVVLNLECRWSVSPQRDAFHLPNAVTHEVGHVLGLGDVADDGNPDNGDETDATMYGETVTGEWQKETLTPGDIEGAQEAMPARG